MNASAWRADPDEAEAVARLLVAFRDENGKAWPSANAFLATVERLIERDDTEFLLGAADADSPPSGICQLRFRLSVWTAADDCWLEDLYVLPGSRGRGVGEALVDLALARAKTRGCRRVELDTGESNERALALYRKLGFTDESKGTGARDLLLGRKLD
ncbi:MAG: GNAT family N-acetyltransferase [Solirubrobacteraceae bacterium]